MNNDKVLRASRIGHPCDRNLWYSVNNYKSVISPKTKRIFDIGTALEPLIVEWLRNEGWHVDYNQGSQNANVEFKIPVKGGILAGHPDCFISKDNLNFSLIDIKTMNERAFLQWKHEGSLKSKSQYVDQIHVYAMGAFQGGFYGVQNLGICGMNKNNAEILIDFFDFDKDRADFLKIKAESIFALNKPPENNCPDSENKWACNYCEFSNICAICQSQKLKDTKIGNDCAVTEDKNIIDAMELLKEAREMEKAAKDLENEAKKVLDEKIRKQGIKNVRGGNFLLRISEIFKEQFDKKTFENEHPDLLQKYMKKSSQLRYELNKLDT